MTPLKIVRLAILFFVAALTLHATASTLCVEPNGSYGCYKHISAAVAAASPGDTIAVAPGTYQDSVTITIPLSLAALNATIDASGKEHGIFINGMAVAGLSGVHISGFTVKNAQLEGILAVNASNVTISSNTVIDNNLALVDGNCTALPIYEPGEAQDCGEGIHLMGTDHSIVDGNTVKGNSGGILVSDDTGPTHDNLISYNTVMDNPYACGINLASHVPSSTTGANTSFGVYHNTVYGNHSQHNGYSAGGGAGIGIFASAPGAQSYGNVVANNHVDDNGHPGISLHSHAPDQILNDNVIVGNTVENNGADTTPLAATGATGINVYSLLPATGNIISGNLIRNEKYDVTFNVPALVQIESNSLIGLPHGVTNVGQAGAADATGNWWGCIEGPLLAGPCSTASGKSVDVIPWSLAPVNVAPAF